MRRRFGAVEELADWPYSYDDLEPYYSRAEWEVGVAGQAGANPHEGHRSRPYPMPPLSAHPLAESLEEICQRRGLHLFPTPRGVNSRPYQGRPSCIYCESCAGFGCEVGAKGSAQEALIDRAEATGRCEIRSRSMVHRITVDARGRATGCVFYDDAGREHEVRARVVCVCCSAVESARLLLLSRSPRHPDGLGNAHGHVGRHLQFHAVTMGVARIPVGQPPDPKLADRHPFLGRSLMDHYFLPDGVASLAKGGILRFGMFPRSPLNTAAFLVSRATEVPWGEDLKALLTAHYRDFTTVHCEAFHDFLPNRQTFVELDPEVRDIWGLAVARIHLGVPEHHRIVGRWLFDRAAEILSELGAEEITATDLGGTSSYLVHGTCRAGHDSRSSVLNPYCQVHDIANLFVVDGSFMPTSGGASPTLTILANSFRVADHLVARLRSGEL